MRKKSVGYGSLAKAALAAALAAGMVMSSTTSSLATKELDFIEKAIQCKILFFTDHAKHAEVCGEAWPDPDHVGTESIYPTGSGTPEVEVYICKKEICFVTISG